LRDVGDTRLDCLTNLTGLSPDKLVNSDHF